MSARASPRAMGAFASPRVMSAFARSRGEIDPKKRTDFLSSSSSFVRTIYGHLPAGDTPNAGKVVETAAVTISVAQGPVPISATHEPESFEYADWLEQPQEMAKTSAEDSIAALQRQLEEQQVANASLRSQLEEHRSAQLLWNASLRSQLEEHRSAQLLWSASLAERVAKLESSGKAVAETDVIISLSPDAHEATGDQPEAVAEIDPDATMDGADTAEHEYKCELEESMWDCALFLHRPDLGVGVVVTFWAVLILLLNILLQMTIALIVFNMDDPTYKVRFIEDLWCAREPRFASAGHIVCFGMACNLL